MKQRSQQHYRAASIAGLLLSLLLANASFAQGGQPQDRQFTGSGTVTTLGNEDCTVDDDIIDDPDVCVQIDGTVNGQGFGSSTYTTQLNILFSEETSNGSEGGICAPASGTFAITAANNRVVAATMAGLVCEVPTGSDPTPQTFNGSFILTNSGEALTGLRGTGRITFSIDGDESLLLIQGVFQ